MRLPGASCVTAATRHIPPRKIQICPAYRRQVLKQALSADLGLAQHYPVGMIEGGEQMAAVFTIVPRPA
jgi:hypothetical protein